MSHPNLDQIGGYRVLEYINEGGMAWVFKVQHPNLDRRLALKLLKTSAGSGDEVRLFKREIDQLTKATHPNLVWILDQGQDAQTGSFWYAMEYLAGDTVRQQVARDGPMGAEAAVKLFSGLLAGLQTLHSRNVVHRDIKPSNIMIEPGHQAKLMDLGIARVLEGDGSEDVSYTNANVVRGTPAYMAPEQSAAKTLTPAADVFAVGLTLYYALTGHTVYEDLADVDSTSAEDIRGYLYYLDRQHRNLQLQLPKRIPRGLQDVIRKSTHTEPGERYQTAGEMLTELEKSLTGGSNVGWIAAAAGAIVLIATLVFAGMYFFQPPNSISGPWDAAREAALAEQQKAKAAKIPQPEYSAVMDAAVSAMTAAQKQLDSATNDDARRSTIPAFQRVAALFVEVSAFPAAHERRAQAMALEKRKREHGVKDFKRWEKIKRSAELAYRNQHYTNAEDDFTKGIAYLNPLVENGPPVINERSPSEEQVVARKGERLTLSVKATDPEGKAVSYAWSVDGTAQIEATGATLEFRPSAESHEIELVISDADGRKSRALWTVTAGRPLTLVSALPAQQQITVDRNETIELSVEASGRNLTYAWTIDGQSRPETGPSLRFVPRQSAKAQVVVRDASDGRVNRSWQVTVKGEGQVKRNRLRILSRSPVAPKATTERGKTVELRVEASGDDLEYSWKIGSSKQSDRGPSLSFRAQSTARVEVSIRDKYGRTTTESWDVVVARAAPGAGPVVSSRSPESSTVKVARGGRVSLEIKARGDQLSYAWSVDGRRASETGSKLSFTINSNTRVEALVTDAKGRSPEGGAVKWRIQVNQAPVISGVTPSQNATLRQGDSKRFRIAASDPDGDSLETEWRRDGRRVARGRDYTLEANEPGTVRLTAVAKDAWDSTELPVVVKVEPRALVSPLDRNFKALLGDFELAYESCSKAQLSRIWQIPAAEDAQWRHAVCKADFDLSVSLMPGTASEDTGKRSAMACAQWVLSRGTRGTVTKQVTFRVLLRPDWNAAQVVEVADGCES